MLIEIFLGFNRFGLYFLLGVNENTLLYSSNSIKNNVFLFGDIINYADIFPIIKSCLNSYLKHTHTKL